MMESKIDVIEIASSMASVKESRRGFGEVYSFTFKDNPYYRKHKMHNVWHNAFYDQCRIIGRSLKNRRF